MGTAPVLVAGAGAWTCYRSAYRYLESRCGPLRDGWLDVRHLKDQPTPTCWLQSLVENLFHCRVPAGSASELEWIIKKALRKDRDSVIKRPENSGLI
jgi:hypothetical protein